MTGDGVECRERSADSNDCRPEIGYSAGRLPIHRECFGRSLFVNSASDTTAAVRMAPTQAAADPTAPTDEPQSTATIDSTTPDTPMTIARGAIRRLMTADSLCVIRRYIDPLQVLVAITEVLPFRPTKMGPGSVSMEIPQSAVARRLSNSSPLVCC